MNYNLFISALFFALGGIFSMQRQLQMFQQNSYFLGRYFKWLKGSVSINLVYSLLFLIFSLTLTLVNAVHFLPIIAAAECIVRIIKQKKLSKQSIKKLVYTSRVKRLIFTSSVINIALIILSVIFPFLSYIFVSVIILMTHFPQILLMLSFALNSPLEKSINNKYINEAKAILSKNKDLTVIGVTGSFGKTSVKFILNRILSEKFNVVATPESFNTPLGVVRTVREHLKPQTEIFIAEMGAKKRYDIKELCNLANPKIGLISAVGEQHLETFFTLENVADTKFELAEHCLKNEGSIYVNFDSPPAANRAEKLESKANVISVGTSPDTLCRAENISFGRQGTSFDVVYKDYRFNLKCQLLGKHSITNILLATAVALDLGVNEKQIRFAVTSLKAPPHRLELKGFMKGSLLIDDAYNSNPEGCLEAVRVLNSFEGMRRVIVTPGLVELGEKEYECNYNLGLEASKCCDDIILVGKKRAVPMKDAIEKTDFNKDRLFVAESFKQAMEYFSGFADRNTVVLFENDLPDNYAG